ncbi:hypothetical protein HanRHA438_Chr08g0352291 [Helianthus annuus]|nr:hypothetical protein HanRHA438_Chr08g0352291 [Helianthus annuus]
MELHADSMKVYKVFGQMSDRNILKCDIACYKIKCDITCYKILPNQVHPVLSKH